MIMVRDVMVVMGVAVVVVVRVWGKDSNKVEEMFEVTAAMIWFMKVKVMIERKALSGGSGGGDSSSGDDG